MLVQSGLWQVVKQAATFLSGLDQWYPYDVSMNIVHSFHHTRIHEDCESYEVTIYACCDGLKEHLISDNWLWIQQ